ncbi:hypothetical protein [Burkholderia gladioli]|uniref:hypothetical protein n=1 Tax=Burkholderia gladioli TaxID=28095 RepID=UPI0034DB430C
MKAKHLLLFFSYLMTSLTLHAKECASARECSIFTSSKGDVIYRTNGKDEVLLKSSDSNALTYTTYVSQRNKKYYLIHESTTNDRNLAIIPIDIVDQSASFKRILFISIDLMQSSKKGHEVWSGREYNLSNPSKLNNFSWDEAYDWQDKLQEDEIKLETPKDIPNGFSSTPISIYEQNGKKVGSRILLYKTRDSLNPDNIVCFKNCDPLTETLSGDFIGFIGKYPIHALLNEKDGKITGDYSYDGKASKLYLSGTIQNNESISANEYDKQDMKNQTGTFTMSKYRSYLSGIWSSPRNNSKFPVILLQDSIYH